MAVKPIRSNPILFDHFCLDDASFPPGVGVAGRRATSQQRTSCPLYTPYLRLNGTASERLRSLLSYQPLTCLLVNGLLRNESVIWPTSCAFAEEIRPAGPPSRACGASADRT